MHKSSLLLLLFLPCLVYAQVPGIAINNSGALPAASAILDISSNSQGVLFPRMTASQMNNINNPELGLIVFTTGVSSGFNYFDGTNWRPFGGGSGGAFASSGGRTYSLYLGDDFVFGTAQSDYNSGTERKFLFNSSKGAFRAGTVTGQHWDAANLGVNSFASGYNNKVGGTSAFAAGHELKASSMAEVVIGVFNETYTPSSSTSYNSTDRLFVVGNGTSANNRSNAMTLLKSGKLGLGTVNPADLLHLEGSNFDQSALRFNNTANSNTTSWRLGQRAFQFHNYMSFEHDGNSLVAFSNSGRVGIGYTSPNYGTLQIKQTGDSNDDGLSIFNTSEQRSVRLYADNADVAHLNSGDGSNVLTINENGGFLGVGKSSASTNVDIEGSTNPSLRISETNQSGYFEVTGYADSQTQLKHKNETANESSMLDIDAVSNGVADQSIRLFRNANIGSNGYFRIYNPGTTTENFRIDASNGNAIVGNSSNYTGDIYAYGGDIKLYNSINNSVGYASISLDLDNSTDDAEAEIRLARTSGTAYLGLELNSKSRDGIRFQTGVSSLLEVGRFDENGLFSLKIGGSVNEFSSDATLNGNSDQAIPTEKAIKSYVDVGLSSLKIDDLTDASDGQGNNNLFLGLYAGSTNTSGGSNNTAVGRSALKDLTTGDHNTSMGYASLFDHIAGNSNTSIGSYSMTYGDINNTGNTVVGYAAMRGISSSKFNNASYNTALGYYTLANITTGDYNTAFGSSALRSLTSGTGNNAFGRHALFSNQTGNYNVALGERSGYSTTGEKNVFLGYSAGYYETGSNKLYIDNSSTTMPLIKGDFTANTVEVNGDLETNDLKVNGDLQVTGSINVPSGYNGDAQKIYITPGDLTFPDNNQTDAWLEDASSSCGSCGGDGCASYGGSMNIEYGDDAFIIMHIPRGYQLVGWKLYFSNAPDDIVLRECYITTSTCTSLYTDISPNNISDINLATGDYVDGGGSEYPSIQFQNDDNGCNSGGHRIVFSGGYLKIQKCTSGCGL